MSSWISVADELPDFDVNVLVWEAAGFPLGPGVNIARRDPDVKDYEWVWAGPIGDSLTVTHWMPLPEQP